MPKFIEFTSSAATGSYVELGLPEVAFRTMVASALQPVQLDDKLWLAVVEQRGRRNAVCWLAPTHHVGDWLALCHLSDLRICHMLCVGNAEDLP